MTDLFTEDNKARTEQGNGEDNRTETSSYLERLIQESPHLKEKKQDELLEELAKARYFGNSHIGKIETENEELRKELDKRLTLEEFIDKMNNTRNNQEFEVDRENNSNQREEFDHQGAREVVNERADPQEVYLKVKQLFEQESKQTQRQQNLATVSETLRQAWGGTWKQDLRVKAHDLGLGEDFLNNLAQESPKAFLELVGARRVDTNVNPPSTRQASEASRFNRPHNPTGAKTYKDYSKLRKENPKAYYSVDVQRQMEKDLKTLGEAAFYK